eukprot:scaffold2876_cov123-Isochrysis_galbana.AAC.3
MPSSAPRSALSPPPPTATSAPARRPAAPLGTAFSRGSKSPRSKSRSSSKSSSRSTPANPASKASSPSSATPTPDARRPALPGLGYESTLPVGPSSDARSIWLISSSFAAPPSPSRDSSEGGGVPPGETLPPATGPDPPPPPAAKPSRGAVSEARSCSGGDGARLAPDPDLPCSSGGIARSCSSPQVSASSRSSCNARTTCDLRGRMATPPGLCTPSGASCGASDETGSRQRGGADPDGLTVPVVGCGQERRDLRVGTRARRRDHRWVERLSLPDIWRSISNAWGTPIPRRSTPENQSSVDGCSRGAAGAPLQQHTPTPWRGARSQLPARSG